MGNNSISIFWRYPFELLASIFEEQFVCEQHGDRGSSSVLLHEKYPDVADG